jgi:hypothetical protein
VQAERETGDNAEIPAATPDGPEQVGIRVAIGGADRRVSGDDLDLLKIVDRPTEATR